MTDSDQQLDELGDDGDGFARWFDERFDHDSAAGGTGERDADHTDVDDANAFEETAPAVAAPHRSVWARITRRPRAWWDAPWTNDRVVQLLVTAAALSITTLAVMFVVHFLPWSPDRDLIFDNTTPTGGDMGAHVWAPAYLRDHLLPRGLISGWSMEWYGGLPLYRFYMVIPALAILALDVVLPYGIAFKVVAMSGLVLFPLACWAFGRLAGMRHPIPELFAFAGICFLFDESFEIYGGNVKSTMAGEYSFSIALTLAVFGLGLLAHGLRTGKFRVWSAVVLSLAAVSHGIVLIFVAIAATVLCLVWIDKTRARYAITTGLATLLLSAWWVGPFLFGHEFMTDMKYGYRPRGSTDSFWDVYFPLTPALDILVTTLAIIGFVAFVLRRELTGTAIGLVCILLGVAVWHTRESLPVIGLLWNPRLLPFLYLMRYFLMVVGALEVITWAVNAVRSRQADRSLTPAEGGIAFGVLALSMLLVFGWMYQVLPGGGRVPVRDGEASVYAWGPFQKPDSTEEGYRSRSVADGWTRYNWEGYEGRPAYPAYHHLVTTMDDVGEQRGCGRALWENNEDNSEFGTTMALMLLPHWTDGCIASMEGLFFEATASTNYHFIAAAAVSENSSEPVRQLRYTKNDAETGVQHMRDLGVRYLMLRTDPAKNEAAGVPDLSLVASSGTWDVYELADAAIVEALTTEPVVVSQADDDWFKPGDQRERNLEVGTSWFQNRSDWPAVPVDDGPLAWQRVTAEIADEQRIEPFDPWQRRVDYVRPSVAIVPRSLDPIEVTNVEVGDHNIDFTVDQIGIPVIVKVSYFPNWNVSGAQGPYRAGANQMVVVPTSTEVSLNYDARSNLDWFFYGMTLLGIGFCVLLRIRGDVAHSSPVAAFRPRRDAEVAFVPPPFAGDWIDDEGLQTASIEQRTFPSLPEEPIEPPGDFAGEARAQSPVTSMEAESTDDAWWDPPEPESESPDRR